jgi:hypothetical protein
VTLPAFALLALAFLAMPAMLACGNADRDAARDSALGNASPDAAAPSRESRQGTFVDGDERSTWTLTRSADGSTSIEDEARFGDDGQANRVFTFDKAGTLVRATEQRTGTSFAGDRSPVPMRSELIVDFTTAVPSARKMVDDAPRDVQSFEIDNLRRRAALLRAQAYR